MSRQTPTGRVAAANKARQAIKNKVVFTPRQAHGMPRAQGFLPGQSHAGRRGRPLSGGPAAGESGQVCGMPRAAFPKARARQARGRAPASLAPHGHGKPRVFPRLPARGRAGGAIARDDKRALLPAQDGGPVNEHGAAER